MQDEDRIGEKIFGIGGINRSVKPEIDKIDPTEEDNCIKFVLEREGGYVDDPRDPGVETKYVISKQAQLDIVNIANLTVEQAKAIYKQDCWDKARCDELPGPVALAVFDSAVNHGLKAAGVLLQKSLGVEPNGDIEPVTLNAVKRADR